MSTVLAATKRTDIGRKGVIRQGRLEGKVPAIIYGGTQAPEAVFLSFKQLDQELHQSGFFSHLFEIDLEDKKQRVIARDIQFHPVTDRPLHADFMRVTKDAKVSVSISLRFINEDKSPGLKVGGVLNIILHALEISVPVETIPEELVIDLSGLNIGDAVHLEALKLPQGARALHPERDYTLATIVAPSGASEATEEKAATP